MRFKRNFALTAMLIVLALVVAACGGGKKDEDTTTTNGANDVAAEQTTEQTAGETIVINMEMMAYVADDVTIPPGTTVKFVNNESFPMDHDVVQGTVEELADFLDGGSHEPLFQSGILAPGEAWEWTFDDEGEFAYGCTQDQHFRIGMMGKITVKAGAEVPQDLVI